MRPKLPLAKGQVWTGPVPFRSCPDTGCWLFGDDGEAAMGEPFEFNKSNVEEFAKIF